MNRAGENLTFWDGGMPANCNNGRIDGGAGTWDLLAEDWTGVNGTIKGRPFSPAFPYSKARLAWSP